MFGFWDGILVVFGVNDEVGGLVKEDEWFDGSVLVEVLLV